jgi:ferric-dicitrate binding protein FerR (iron transport regulator)
VLDSAAHGQIAQEGGTTVINKTDGQLIYNVTNQSNTTGSTLSNTLKTAKGQTYALTLPDGSEVWLNAASSINYPVAFDDKKRWVKITGEAYFEIKQQSRDQGEKVPFIIIVEDFAGNTSAEVEVLGTHFNINAYQDEYNITTTLLEGKVRINKDKNVTLDKPNQQGVLSKRTGNLTIEKEANIERAIAWKNNYFYFERDSLATVLKQIARWYDVDYVLDKKLSNETFSGRIMRNMPLSKVIEKLSKTSRVQLVLHDFKRFVISPRLKP